MWLAQAVPLPETGDHTSWFLWLLATAICALTTALVYMSKIFYARWNECESQHSATSEKLLTVTKEVGELSGKVHVLTTLSGQTLRQVIDAPNDAN